MNASVQIHAVSVGPAHLEVESWPITHWSAHGESFDRLEVSDDECGWAYSGMTGPEVAEGVGADDDEAVGVEVVEGVVLDGVVPPEQVLVCRARASERSAGVHLLIRHCAATLWKAGVHTHAVSSAPVQPWVCAAAVTQSEAHCDRPPIVPV